MLPRTGLPPRSADHKRWTVRRKTAVLQAVQSDQIDLDDACRLYDLSVDEFRTWQRAFERYGVPGLRATRLQIYGNIRQVIPDRARRLHQVIARFDRLLSSGADAELAEVYRAEIAAARAMLAQIE